jgi:5-methylcytosine-specific restriction endonuclease McrA
MSQESHFEEYGRKLDVHHITPARQFDDAEERNSMGNLEALCIPFHKTVESMAPLRPDARRQSPD